MWNPIFKNYLRISYYKIKENRIKNKFPFPIPIDTLFAIQYTYHGPVAFCSYSLPKLSGERASEWV
jgi:hypothetical protein